MTVLTRPYTYQIDAVRAMLRRGGRALLAADPGLGKSLMALMVADRLPSARPAVVVCPAVVKWNWEREVKKHLGLRAEVLEGTRPPARPADASPQVYVVNYDVLGRRRGESYGPGWLEWLKGLKPQMVVIDECQAIADSRAKRTKWVKELCSGVPHVLALSGTPLVNRPSELWPTLNVLRPDLFPSFWSFGQRWCDPRMSPWGWDFRGASDLPGLHAELAQSVMVRIRMADALGQLPTLRRIVVPLDIADRRQYRKAQDQFLAWLRERHGGARASRAAKAQRIVQLGYLKRLAAELKAPAVADWISQFLEDGDGKLALFGVHRAFLGGLRERFEDLSVVVDGSVTGRGRQAAIDKFLGCPRTRLMLGNIKAASIGWSAKGVSDTAAAEFSWAPGDHIQAERRTVGLGRGVAGVASRSWWLVGRDTVEERLVELLQRKQRVVGDTLDGEGGGERLDVFDRLCEGLLADTNSED